MDNFVITTSTCQNLLIISVIATCTLCLEEASGEIYLEQRNFNPHLYDISEGAPERNNGPVVFPTNPEDNLVENRSNVVTLVTSTKQLKNRHPVDNHPYAKVARKHRYRVTGRIESQNNEVSTGDYQALAKHGDKVLSYPPEELRKTFSPSDEERQVKDYAFSYKVLDHLTGDDFSHSQTRNSKATNGEYRVKLPDGRVQIVSYTADKNGYKADVKYTENEGDAPQRGTSHQGENQQIQRIPIKELYPVTNTKPVEYDINQQNHKFLVLQPILSTQIPAHFNGNGDIVVTPSPSYLNNELQSHHQPKVEIYTTNARDYTIGSYIPVTVTPYPSHNSISSHDETISPEITNGGDHGLFVPSTPSTFVVTDQHGQVLDNIKVVSTTASPLFVENYVTSTPTPTPTPFVLNGGHHRNRFSTAHVY